MSRNEDRRYLVPVDESVTLRNTVAYVLQRAAAAESAVEVHFLAVEATRVFAPDSETELAEARELLDRIEIWAEEDLGENTTVAVETAVVGEDRYLFSPGEYAETILEYAHGHDVDRIVLDPEYDPGVTAPMLRPLATELSQSDVAVEEAPVERAARRGVLVRAATLPKYIGVFAISFLFYMALGPITPFNVVTGVATAIITALLLGPITFGKQPDLPRLVRQLFRMAIYAPYLLWEIAKANVQLAYVVLHPSLPIDPRMVRFRAAVWGDVPVTTLANSITLTPGTLTVDVDNRAFAIHTLIPGAREDLFDGSLERAVRFVFFGRAAARIPSPREREAELEGGGPGPASHGSVVADERSTPQSDTANDGIEEDTDG